MTEDDLEFWIVVEQAAAHEAKRVNRSLRCESPHRTC
jgi:hypothetical protein